MAEQVKTGQALKASGARQVVLAGIETHGLNLNAVQAWKYSCTVSEKIIVGPPINAVRMKSSPNII